MARGHNLQQGAALILVLWLVVGMSLLVLAGARSVRQHTQVAALHSDRLRVQSTLDAAIALGAQQMAVDPRKANGYRRWHLHFAGQDVLLEQVSGDGLVDANVASPELLQALFERVGGLAPGEAALMTSAVRDFIGYDSEGSLGRGGDEAVTTRGGISDISELRDVPGMTPDLYATISPFLGYNGQQRVNVNAAPPALIDALSGQPGLGEAIHATPPAMRSEAMLSGAGQDLFAITPAAGGSSLRLRALVQAADGRVWQRQAWLALGVGTDTIMPWKTEAVEAVQRARGGVVSPGS